MIELVTGLPGSGKTLQTLVRVRERAQKEGRQVYYDGIEGIDEKALPWLKHDGQKWFELPANSIIVIDEAQRLFRPRGRVGEPPEYSSKLETHRHLGIDLVFITQNPMLIDSHVRRLCERHWHVMRKFGTKWATIHEFPSGVREDVDKRREGSIRHEFRYPKEAFGWYKSAEVHTHKAHIPARVWILLAVPLVFGGAAYAAYLRLTPEAQQERIDKSAGVEKAKPGSKHAGQDRPAARPAVMSGRGEHLTTADYLTQQVARVPGLAYTAPVYDEVTRPTEAPYPAACVQSATRCQCYTQQGTRLDVPADLCKSIAEGGFFVAWRQPRLDTRGHGAESATARPQAQLAAPGAESAGAGGFDTRGYGLAARPSEGGAAVAVSAPVEGSPAGRARRTGS